MRQDINPEDETGRLRRHELARVERRQVWRSVVLPFMALCVIVAAIAGAALLLRSPVQVSLLSNSMLAVLVLLPLVVCMFPAVLLSVALVVLASRWHSMSRSPLRRLEAWTATVEQNAEVWLGNVDARILNWAVRLAPFQQLLSAFDAPTVESLDEGIE